MKRTSYGIFISFFVFASVFAVDGLACEGVDMNATGDAYIAAAPDDPVRNYTEGYARFCQGREWRHHIEKASDLGHVTASYFLGQYHRKDKDLNSSTDITEIQDNYDAAIFYYERAAADIESMNSYPASVYAELEERHYMSVRSFLYLARLYFRGYSRALGDMLKNDVSYTDTIKVLDNMRRSAERCLKRPSLTIWGTRQNEIANSKQVICQAQRDFAEKALDLESQRIEITKRCDAALNECTEHQSIFQEIVQANKERISKINSVPKI